MVTKIENMLAKFENVMKNVVFYGLLTLTTIFCVGMAYQMTLSGVNKVFSADVPLVQELDCTDSGCEAAEAAIMPKVVGAADYRRTLPRDKKGLADFKSIKVVNVPADRLVFSKEKRDSFINIYHVDPVDQLQAGGAIRFNAVTINGTVLPGANYNRPNAKDLHSIVRTVGDSLTIFKIIH